MPQATLRKLQMQGLPQDSTSLWSNIADMHVDAAQIGSTLIINLNGDVSCQGPDDAKKRSFKASQCQLS